MSDSRGEGEEGRGRPVLAQPAGWEGDIPAPASSPLQPVLTERGALLPAARLCSAGPATPRHAYAAWDRKKDGHCPGGERGLV